MSTMRLRIASALVACWCVPEAHAGAVIRRALYLGLDQGFVGYWSVEGTSAAGTHVSDAAGQGNRGVMTNGPKLVNGNLGQGMEFDGSNDYVEAGNASSLQLTGAMTISAWIKPVYIDSNVRQDIVAKSAASDRGYAFVLGGDGKIRLEITIGPTATVDGSAVTATPLNTWVHAVGVMSRVLPFASIRTEPRTPT
jgi:hypothetical protein